MIDWKPISNEAKSGEWVLLDGGELGDQWEGEEHRPVVARWAEYNEINGYDWLVSGFDNGYGRLWYNEPTRWALLT